MSEKRTERQTRSNTQKKRRRRRRLSAVGALFYVAFVIGVSTFVATYGWTLANDVLALNKVDHSAVITLPESIFSEKEIEVETDEVDGAIVYMVLFLEPKKLRKEGPLCLLTMTNSAVV